MQGDLHQRRHPGRVGAHHPGVVGEQAVVRLIDAAFDEGEYAVRPAARPVHIGRYPQKHGQGHEDHVGHGDDEDHGHLRPRPTLAAAAHHDIDLRLVGHRQGREQGDDGKAHQKRQGRVIEQIGQKPRPADQIARIAQVIAHGQYLAVDKEYGQHDDQIGHRRGEQLFEVVAQAGEHFVTHTSTSSFHGGRTAPPKWR